MTIELLSYIRKKIWFSHAIFVIMQELNWKNMEKKFAENLEQMFKNEEAILEEFLTELFKEEIRYTSMQDIDDEKSENFEVIRINAMSKNSTNEFCTFTAKFYRFNPNLSQSNLSYIIRKINEFQVFNDMMKPHKTKEIYVFLTTGMMDEDKMNFLYLSSTMTGNSGTKLSSDGTIQESKLTKNYVIDIPVTSEMNISKMLDAIKKEKKE